VGQADLDSWRENGLDRIVECLEVRDPSLGSVESRIRSAVNWYGRAVRANTDDEAFVALVTAMESLLAGEGTSSIRQRLADRMSMLIGSDFQGRERIAGAVKELYGYRCEIVHYGKPASQASLKLLDTMASKTITAFAVRERNGGRP